MNGRKAKQLRREGKRTYKGALPRAKDYKEDDTDYRFNRELYWERRKRTVVVPLDRVVSRSDVIAYVAVKKDEPLKKPEQSYKTLEEAEASIPKRQKKKREVRAIVRKPLSGTIKPAAVVQQAVNDKGELIGIIPISGKRPPKSGRFMAPFKPSVPVGQSGATDVALPPQATGARTNARGD